jgi:hypothetical protein
MKLLTKNPKSNYLAKVVKLSEFKPHPNADKLKIAVVDHYNCIVSNHYKEGDVCIFFPLECKINYSLISWINGFSDPALNSDKKSKGFFSDKCRVKAVKLRGVAAEGYLIPATNFTSWVHRVGVDMSLFEEFIGKEFDTLVMGDYVDGSLKDVETLVCEKYVPLNQRVKGPANTPPKDKTKRFDRMVPGQFHFHVETAQLKKNIHRIYPSDTITITEKLHGTSFVCSNILVKRKLAWKDKIAKFFGIKIQETEYDVIYSSRQVLKNAYLYEDKKSPNHFYKQDIWGLAKDRIKHAIDPGITIYAEIVGQMPGGGWIQKNYDYGCKPGEFQVYVYRITHTDPAGNVLEFTTNQISSYCTKRGLDMVPVHYHGDAGSLVAPYDMHGNVDPRSFEDKFLRYLTETYLEKPCEMSKNNVPAEGVVITVESDQFTAFKLKSFAFYEGESKALDAGEVDIETQESSNE